MVDDPDNSGDNSRAAFAAELARLRSASDRSLSSVADAAHADRTHVSHIEHGRRWPSRPVAAGLDAALGADGALLARWEAAAAAPVPVPAGLDDVAELAALAAHAERSDVTGYVLDTIDATVDEYARAYAPTAPAELLGDVRVLARHVGALLGGRATLAQRRRLMVAGLARPARGHPACGPRRAPVGRRRAHGCGDAGPGGRARRDRGMVD